MSLQDKHLYEFGEFTLDTSEKQLWRGDESIHMPLKAVETLCLLVENHGKLMSKEVLMNELWADTFVEERNLAQNVFTLRKTLGEDKNGTKFIETVPKRGYRFVADVSVTETIEEELIEVTLENKTTIKAEGDFDTEELTKALEITPNSAVNTQPRTTPIKQIDQPRSSGFFSNISPIAMIAIGLISIFTIGAGVWFWKGQDRSKPRTAKFDIANTSSERATNNGTAWAPVVSPNNQFIAYVFHDGTSKDGTNSDGIRLQNVKNGSVTDVVTAENVQIGSPVFSPDGNFIYYAARDGGRAGTLYKVPILGGSKQQITNDVLSDVAISPDGEWFAFIRSEDFTKSRDLVICRTDGSDEKVVSTRSEPNGFLVWGISPDWSPDGKRILTGGFTRAKSGEKEAQEYFVETEVETGNETKVESPNFSRVSQARWLSDGNRIVALAKETAESPMQIWKLSYPDGEAIRVTNDLVDYYRLNVSPDGTFLLTNNRNYTSNISLVDSSTGTVLEKLTETTSINNGEAGLTWTPDGKQIIYSRLENNVGNLWSLDVASKKTRQITFDERKYNGRPKVTPDGEFVVYSSNKTVGRQVWKVRIDGSNPEQITKGQEALFADISTNGKHLFYQRDGKLWRRPLEGGESIEFLNRAEHSFVSNDSTKILVFYFDPKETKKSPWKRAIMSVEGESKSVPIDIEVHRAIDWSSDDSKLYYSKNTRNKSNIWVYSIADKSSTKLTNFDDQQIDFLDVSPDGKKIAIARGTSNSDIVKISGFNR